MEEAGLSQLGQENQEEKVGVGERGAQTETIPNLLKLGFGYLFQ